MRVVVVLPTYNERENIETLLARLSIVTSQIKSHMFSFLIVDDNSPDGTQKAVQLYQKKHKNTYLITGAKEGLGEALLRGMIFAIEKLRAEVLIQMDADLSHDPSVLPRFITAIDSGADIAIGSRYIVGGSIPSNWGIKRKVFSVVGNSIVRFGLGFTCVHDWTGGYRAFRAELFNLVKDEMSNYRGYLFQIAFLHKLLKHKIKLEEVPIHFVDRRFGRSKIAPSEYIRDVLEYVFLQRLQSIKTGSFGKFLVVGTIGFFINTIFLELFIRLGFHPTIGSIVGAEFAILSNFILNNSWTFKNKRITGSSTVWKFLQFNGTSLGSLVIQSGTILVGTLVFGVSTYRQFYMLGVGIGLIWNYIMYSRVIWR